MIPASFDYVRAGSLDEALSALAGGGDEARVLAGGHSLLPLMRLRLARPALLVDIGRVGDLRYVREADGHVAIGALSTHHDLANSDVVRDACPIIADTTSQIGDPQVRHRGTIGGSIAHADPASDLPAALLAADAEIVVASGSGERTVAARDFFVGPFMSALGENEIVTGVRVPKSGARARYLKFHRRAQDWAIVGVAAIVEHAGGTVERASIGLTNMGGTPLRAGAAEAALAGADGDEAIRRAAAELSDVGSPPGDQNASSEFRLHLASVLIARAVRAAMA